MRGVLHVLAALAVMALGFWAYQENFKTQTALRELRGLNAEIGASHRRLNMLQAEWAYLNRPDRLRDLVNINFDRLGLFPLEPGAFSDVKLISFPLPDVMSLDTLTDPVDVSTAAMEAPATGEDPL